MFDINDNVIIKNPGQVYSSYTDWFHEADIGPAIARLHAFGQAPKQDEKMTVVATGCHGKNKDIMLYAVMDTDNKVYIMGEPGLDFAPNSKKPAFKPSDVSFEDLLKGVK